MPVRLTSAAAAVGAFAAVLLVRPACAQQITGPTPYAYGTFGYTDHLVSTSEYGTVQARVGARFNRWLGVEGEFGFGTNRDNIGIGESARITDQEAGYLVGWLPVTPRLDVFMRIGGGHTGWSLSGVPSVQLGHNSWNWGAGGTYFFDHHNGLRAGYTRENFDIGPSSDDVSVSYIRRF